jgi:flagellar biosynthesis/type III secretory pathway M-ring protein FliF/YscJ
MKIEYLLIRILILLVILILIWLILRSIQHRHGSQRESQEQKAKTPRALKPKTEDNCPLCRAKKISNLEKTGMELSPRPWNEVKDKRGRKKTLSTGTGLIRSW